MLSPRPAELAHRVGGSFCVLQQCSPNFCLDSVKQICAMPHKSNRLRVCEKTFSQGKSSYVMSMPQKPGTLFIGRGGTREVSPMRLSTAMPIETRPRYFTPCAQCGDALLAPEWSEPFYELSGGGRCRPAALVPGRASIDADV